MKTHEPSTTHRNQSRRLAPLATGTRRTFAVLLLTLAAWAAGGAAQAHAQQRRSIMYDPLFPGGPTYGKVVEDFCSEHVFPREITYKGIGARRETCVVEEVEAVGNDYAFRVRARYRAVVALVGTPWTETARVHYDRGDVRLDYTEGVRGVFNTKGIRNFLASLQSRPSGGEGGGAGGGGQGQEFKIWIENPTQTRLHYKLNGENFAVEPGQTRWHARLGNPEFLVEFDRSPQPGYQPLGYRLTPGTNNFFTWKGDGWDLPRR